MSRRRSGEDLKYDPKIPPVIHNLATIVHRCLTSQGFGDRLIEEIKCFVCLFRMPEARYKYSTNDHKQLTWCHFSAAFGPQKIFTVFRANRDGDIQIKTETPLAKELLHVQDNGEEIFLRGHNWEKKRWSSDEEDDSDENEGTEVTNHSHLFQLRSYYRSETSSTPYSKCLNVFIVYPHIVFVEEGNYTYAGKHGDCEEGCSVGFYASSVSDNLIAMLNNGVANLMKQIAEKCEDLPKGSLLSLLTGHIHDERWNLDCIFALEQNYECDESMTA